MEHKKRAVGYNSLYQEKGLVLSVHKKGREGGKTAPLEDTEVQLVR